MSRDYKLAVYIGRFQPLHNGHVQIIKHGLEIADKVVVIVGSANSARTIKNPFSYWERERMIKEEIMRDNYMPHFFVRPLRDYYYNDLAWTSNVQSITDEFISEGDSVALLGSLKDSTSQYLKWFPQWDHVTTKTEDINATDIRDVLFDIKIGTDYEGKPTQLPDSFPSVRYLGDEGKITYLDVPKSVDHFLYSWVRRKEYAELNKEYEFLTQYKESWKSSPFPPTFTTADTVVVCSGHVLVIKRKHNPGKGLYALPGGFKKTTETFLQAAIRELKEETGIRLEKIILETAVAEQHLFDHPDRSLRGCTISNAYYIKLKDGKLPEVKGGDDASHAIWMPLWDVNKNETMFFEDHVHIINYFLGV